MLQQSRQGTVRVISGETPLTVEQLPQLQEMLESLWTLGQPKLVLDLRHVLLLDGVVLEVLLETRQAFEKKGGGLKLSAPNALCRDVLKITRLQSHFESYEELQQAVGSFAK